MIASLLRFRWIFSAVGLVILVAAYPYSNRLETEKSIASLFGERDPTLRDYRNMKRWFGRNDVLVLMYRDEDLVSKAGIERSGQLTDEIKSLEGVAATLSPEILNRAAEAMDRASVLPFRLGSKQKEPETPKLMRPDDPVGAGLSDIFSGYTHSADYSHAAVVVMIDDSRGPETVESLKDIARRWSRQPEVDGVSLVGEPVLIEEAFSLVRRDGARLATVTVTLLSIVVAISLLDYRLVFLLALVIAWSVTTTRALMYAMDIPLSLIASILTAIVTVVAVTAVLHVGVQYHVRRNRGSAPLESALIVMRRMAGPVFWTCATDAAGFAALWFSEILPVRQFGVMVATSAVGVFIAVVLFAPSLLTMPEWTLTRRAVSVRHLVTRWLRRQCVRAATFFVNRRRITILTALVLMVASIVLVSRSETETSFLKNFRDDSAIVVDYGNVENNLGGAGVWDLVLDVPAVLTNEFLDGVLELEDELLDKLGGSDGLVKAISLADATETLGRSTTGKWMTAPLRVAAMRTRLPTFIGALISDPLPEDPRRRKLRIMLRSSEGLPAERKRELIEGTQRIAEQHLARWEPDRDVNDGDRAIVTGYYVIMTRLVDQLVSDQWRCFIASAVLILLLMSFAVRDFRLATAALLPNLLPAFLVLSVVSVYGGRINLGAAMIAAVSVGLSIDGSVHLLTAYRRRRRFGNHHHRSAVSAAGNIGAPVMLATIALVAGFSVLSTSEFIPTATFGTLVAWTLVIGTLVNLTVLPALIGRD